MIAYDAEYYRPTTFEEAIELFHTLNKDGKKPMYFSGGTEIITLDRTNRIIPGAIIDIKSIRECHVADIDKDEIRLGAALSLTKVNKTGFFPLLNQTISQIADHTARNKITLGGNICGNIPYREAVLPFLLTNSKAVIASKSEVKEHPFESLFNNDHRLNTELLLQVKVSRSEVELPFVSIKKRRQWGVGYPLITAAAVMKNNRLKIAFSGLCNFPFHDAKIDKIMNDGSLSKEGKAKEIVNSTPAPVLDDVHGSAEYREFVLGNLLEEIEGAFKGASL
ncbi:FAD binding domain-containing protein [Sporosarcina koreensis]|uniref:FAD binding domain-containing protein n=1 Tax=Sporosarcina koreensis TaxID=334735 RepID=A0ABW0U1Y4_9BACL